MLRTNFTMEVAGSDNGFIIPANATIHLVAANIQTLDPGVRRDDERKCLDFDVEVGARTHLKAARYAYICGVAA
jgi:hypothetical protein